MPLGALVRFLAAARREPDSGPALDDEMPAKGVHKERERAVCTRACGYSRHSRGTEPDKACVQRAKKH